MSKSKSKYDDTPYKVKITTAETNTSCAPGFSGTDSKGMYKHILVRVFCKDKGHLPIHDIRIHPLQTSTTPIGRKNHETIKNLFYYTEGFPGGDDPREINAWAFETFGRRHIHKTLKSLRRKLLLEKNADLKLHFAMRGKEVHGNTCKLIDEHEGEIRQMISDGNRKLVWLSFLMFDRFPGTFSAEPGDGGAVKRMKVYFSNEVKTGFIPFNAWKHLCSMSEFALKKMYLSDMRVYRTRTLEALKNIPVSMSIKSMEAVSHHVKSSELSNRPTIKVMENIIRSQGTVKSVKPEEVKEILDMANDCYIMVEQIEHYDQAAGKKTRKAMLKLKSMDKLTALHDKITGIANLIRDADYKKHFDLPKWVTNFKWGKTAAVYARSKEELHKIAEDQRNCIYSRKNSCSKVDSIVYAIKRRGVITSAFELAVRRRQWTPPGDTEFFRCEIAEHKSRFNHKPSPEDSACANYVKLYLNKRLNAIREEAAIGKHRQKEEAAQIGRPLQAVS